MSDKAKQVPAYEIAFSNPRYHPYLLVIPVSNEGKKIHSLIKKMQALDVMQKLDICVVDAGSTDGSLDEMFLQSKGVHALLAKKGPGQYSAQLLCAYDYALRQEYTGVITIEGNDTDDAALLPLFIKALDEGVDFVQASRFIPGRKAEKTPWNKFLAVRWILAPLLSFFSGYSWTDTLQGYRAYSSRLLNDKNLFIFRDVFVKYELPLYLSFRAPRLGFKCLEVPVSHVAVLSDDFAKDSRVRSNLEICITLFKTCLGYYNP